MTANQSVTAGFVKQATTTTTTTTTTPTPKPSCTLTPGSAKVFAAADAGTARAARATKPARGVLNLTARCTQAASGRISGSITVVRKSRKPHGKPSTKTISVPARTVALIANTSRTVTITVPKAALRALKAGAKESVRFTLTAAGPGGATTASARIAHLKYVALKKPKRR
jgi:hypothetical protein